MLFQGNSSWTSGTHCSVCTYVAWLVILCIFVTFNTFCYIQAQISILNTVWSKKFLFYHISHLDLLELKSSMNLIFFLCWLFYSLFCPVIFIFLFLSSFPLFFRFPYFFLYFFNSLFLPIYGTGCNTFRVFHFRECTIHSLFLFLVVKTWIVYVSARQCHNSLSSA